MRINSTWGLSPVWGVDNQGWSPSGPEPTVSTITTSAITHESHILLHWLHLWFSLVRLCSPGQDTDSHPVTAGLHHPCVASEKDVSDFIIRFFSLNVVPRGRQLTVSLSLFYRIFFVLFSPSGWAEGWRRYSSILLEWTSNPLRWTASSVRYRHSQIMHIETS